MEGSRTVSVYVFLFDFFPGAQDQRQVVNTTARTETLSIQACVVSRTIVSVLPTIVLVSPTIVVVSAALVLISRTIVFRFTCISVGFTYNSVNFTDNSVMFPCISVSFTYNSVRFTDNRVMVTSAGGGTGGEARRGPAPGAGAGRVPGETGRGGTRGYGLQPCA